MKNNRLAALQAKRNTLKKAIKDKQKAMDYFDVSEYYGEDMLIEEMHEAFGYVDIMGINIVLSILCRKLTTLLF